MPRLLSSATTSQTACDRVCREHIVDEPYSDFKPTMLSNLKTHDVSLNVLHSDFMIYLLTSGSVVNQPIFGSDLEMTETMKSSRKPQVHGPTRAREMTSVFIAETSLANE